MTSAQQPVGSGFSAHTTAQEALGDARLDGKTVIVTGGYAGIGLETTRVLANAGATVIAAGRSPEKARASVAHLPRVEVEALDLADPASINSFAKRFLSTGRALHLLINNAGIMATPLHHDARGFESQFATNHFGHFQLTQLLWPALLTAGGARIICVSSRGHRRSGIDFADPHFHHRPYDKWVAYGQSKTANILHAVALDARGEARGIHAFSLHPGGIKTELMRSLSDDEQKHLLALNTSLKSIEQGAATTVWCATSAKLNGLGGVYCEDCDVAPAVSAQFEGGSGVWPWAVDHDAAEQLWALSERAVAIVK